MIAVLAFVLLGFGAAIGTILAGRAQADHAMQAVGWTLLTMSSLMLTWLAYR